jgi:transcriptional regulator with GAF, ATPase, and Fis domain
MSTEIKEKLADLKKKQATILATWQKVGNKALLQFITEVLPGGLNAERCGIFIVDPESNKVWIVGGTYIDERTVLASLDSSIVGKVIKSGEPIEEAGLENKVGDHDIAGVKTGFITRNVLCVPVKNKSGDTVIGAIQLLNKCGGAFVEADRQRLEQLAGLLQPNLEQVYQHQQMIKMAEDMGRVIHSLEQQLIKANLAGG